MAEGVQLQTKIGLPIEERRVDADQSAVGAAKLKEPDVVAPLGVGSRKVDVTQAK